MKKKCRDCKEVIYPELQGYMRWPTGILLHIDCWEKQKKEVSVILS